MRMQRNLIQWEGSASQTMNIVDLAIHGVVCQKSDFHGNSDIQKSQMLDPLEITEKKHFQANIC
jgi:hypothetical protein